MLLANPPVNMSASSGQPELLNFDGRQSRYVYEQGSFVFAVIESGVIASGDGGTTWLLKDGRFGTADLGIQRIFCTRVGNVLHIATIYDFPWKCTVYQFSLTSKTYIDTSAELTQTSSVYYGFGLANADGDFYLVTGDDTDSLTAIPLVYFVLSSGTWSASNTLDATAFASAQIRYGAGMIDSNGDVHAFYTTFPDFAGFTGPDTTLKHVKLPSGTPDTILTVDPMDTSTSYDLYDAMAWDGATYLAYTFGQFDQYVLVSDSDTAPTTWTPTLIANGGAATPNDGKFIPHVASSTLYLFYELLGTANQIYYNAFAAATWGIQILVYDLPLNPTSGTVTNILGHQPIRLASGDFAAAIDAFDDSGPAVWWLSMGTGPPPPTGRVLNFQY